MDSRAFRGIRRRLGRVGFGLSRELRERGLVSRPLGFPAPLAPASARRDRYERDGFVLGGRLLDRRRLARLRSDFDRVFARRDEPAARVRQRSVEEGGRAYYCIYELRDHSSAFAELVRDPRLVAMLSELTGVESFLVVIDQVQFKPARVGGENGWHRDWPTFPLIDPYTAITAWVALDDAVERTGCMHMVPESHLWGDARDIATDWGLRELPQVYRGHAVRPVPCPVPAGYVHFHHDRVWHSSGPNRSPWPRRALAISYVNADARHSADGLSEYEELPYGAPMSQVLGIRVTRVPAAASAPAA